MTHPDPGSAAREVTNAASVAVAARGNDAGASVGTYFLDVRREFETNIYGPLLVPVIERKGGGHLLNVHSVLSWIANDRSSSASKTALWSQTLSLRPELQPRGIAVTGLRVGCVDTDLTTGVDAPKSDPRDVAAPAFDGIETYAH